jgi:hypothetical protein
MYFCLNGQLPFAKMRLECRPEQIHFTFLPQNGIFNGLKTNVE